MLKVQLLRLVKLLTTVLLLKLKKRPVPREGDQ